MKVAIAGASGFIGKALVQELSLQHRIIALSRSQRSQSQKNTEGAVEWRTCDLFSLLDAEKALVGADVAVYLVHSMRPNAHLTQGNFADFDLIVADNFVRAAQKNRVKHIIFLGGLHPEDYSECSLHLKSRKEVEDVFVDSGLPYTILRAAMIIGAEGSSFHIMTRLVERLPAMLCPTWSQTRSQPVALSDVILALSYCLGRKECQNKIFDLGGTSILSYREMMGEMAKLLGKKRRMIPVPFMSPGLSSLWVSLITGAPKDLVDPLIEGLRIDLVADPRRELKIPGHRFMNIQEALALAFQSYDHSKAPHAFQSAPVGYHEVRSVQRLPLPKNWNAGQVARAYMRFLPRLHTGLIKVEVDVPWINFSVRFPYYPLLILEYAPLRSWDHRHLFYVRGGLLSQKSGRGRLEFREILGGKACIAAIHDFRPKLPWPIYMATQALFHLWVMKQFGRHLARHSRRAIKSEYASETHSSSPPL
ncbi:NAD(P)H-binding protein [Bdellovibrio sp. HCB2-146]|uniref:NAD(P)H-binding protein n=1 Tax=Bdellovibrio sp. HCB2-146 TaxID=3394362 RepID=UPI0039BD5F0F